MQVLSRPRRMRRRRGGRGARPPVVRVSSDPTPVEPIPACALAWRRVDGASDDPLVPFGQLHGVLLCQHRLRDGRTPRLLRELVPILDPRRGRCVWRSGPVVCDLARPWLQIADPLSIKPWQRTLLHYAEVLSESLASADAMVKPILPYTLMSVPIQSTIVPRPTRAITQIAEQEGVHWTDAWHRLSRERHLPGSDDLLHIDTRLCDRIKPGLTWPGAVALMHDLRDVPMTHVWRPPLGGSVAESLFVYQPHAILDGWNAPEPLMQRLGMEYFPPPAVASLL